MISIKFLVWLVFYLNYKQILNGFSFFTPLDLNMKSSRHLWCCEGLTICNLNLCFFLVISRATDVSSYNGKVMTLSQFFGLCGSTCFTMNNAKFKASKFHDPLFYFISSMKCFISRH